MEGIGKALFMKVSTLSGRTVDVDIKESIACSEFKGKANELLGMIGQPCSLVVNRKEIADFEVIDHKFKDQEVTLVHHQRTDYKGPIPAPLGSIASYSGDDRVLRAHLANSTFRRKIQEIHLIDNNISELPKEIDQCPNLERVYLKRTNIKHSDSKKIVFIKC